MFVQHFEPQGRRFTNLHYYVHVLSACWYGTEWPDAPPHFTVLHKWSPSSNISCSSLSLKKCLQVQWPGPSHVQCCFTSPETIRDREPRTSTSTLTQLLSSELLLLSWCLMSSDVIWHIRDKLWPMPKHGSIRKVYACLAVTCHLHFWQNDRDFLRATVVTRGWNGYRNKSQHRKSTLEKKILPPFQQGFEPATFQSRVRRSNHWAIPAPLSSELLQMLLYVHRDHKDY